jgi:NAD(P)-dependent dehydrogenase (short-subunit alcohol dehydrogenase family)
MTTRITTPFSFESTADEVAAGVDLTGRRAIVTGGASGIGIETARTLARAGAEVTLAVRDRAAGERTAEDITATTGSKEVRVAHLDLADQASVRAFAASWDGPLHILVNNAGVACTPETRTPEGWELQFATNHLGHFALATGLHRALAAAGGARVVSVSSSGHLVSPVVFEDIHFRERPYEAWSAYGQSKTANVLFAVSPLLEGVGGRYFEDCNEAELNQSGTRRGVAAYALDPEAATRLWKVSTETLAR